MTGFVVMAGQISRVLWPNLFWKGLKLIIFCTWFVNTFSLFSEVSKWFVQVAQPQQLFFENR